MDTFLFQDFGSVLSFKLIEQSDRIRLMELTSSKRTREGQRCRLSLEVVRGLGEPVTALGTSPSACRGLCTNSSPLGGTYRMFDDVTGDMSAPQACQGVWSKNRAHVGPYRMVPLRRYPDKADASLIL